MAGKGGRRVAADPATKDRALRLAAECGVVEASRETGVPQGTIRAWRHRAGEAGAPRGVDPVEWAARKQRGAEEAWEAAGKALKEVTRLLAAGKHADAQRTALTMAILVDKSGVLEAAAQAAEGRRIVLEQAQTEFARRDRQDVL